MVGKKEIVRLSFLKCDVRKQKTTTIPLKEQKRKKSITPNTVNQIIITRRYQLKTAMLTLYTSYTGFGCI